MSSAEGIFVLGYLNGMLSLVNRKSIAFYLVKSINR